MKLHITSQIGLDEIDQAISLFVESATENELKRFSKDLAQTINYHIQKCGYKFELKVIKK